MRSFIQFLGTGGDPIVIGKQIRASGGIIVKYGNTQLHIDPGPGALVRLQQADLNVRETTAVLISNPSWMAMNDAAAIIAGMSHAGMDKRGVLVTTKEIINGDEQEPPIMPKSYQAMLEKVIALNAGTKIGINDIDIEGTHASGITPTIGFKISTNEFVMGYTSHTSYSEAVAESFKDTNILIVNCKNPLDNKDKGFMNTEDVIALVKKVKPDLTVLTGFGIKFLQADVLTEAREIQKEAHCQVVAAKDGMIINPVSYSTSVRQKTLKAFGKS